MTRYETYNANADFGCKAKWYMPENLEAVKNANRRRWYGKRAFLQAYFVQRVWTVRDDYRDFRPVYEESAVIAGPFATEEDAHEWVAANC